MADLLRAGAEIFERRAGEQSYGETRDAETKKTAHEPRPFPVPDRVKTSQGDAHSQQAAAEKPKGRRVGGEALAHRPPKTAEKKCAEQKAGSAGQDQD